MCQVTPGLVVKLVVTAGLEARGTSVIGAGCNARLACVERAGLIRGSRAKARD